MAPKQSDVWTTKWFEIDSGYFEDVEYYIWLFFVKVLTIGILSLWYISCNHSWRTFLIIPLSIEFYKIFSIWDTAVYNTDGGIILFIYSLSISIPFILLLFYFSKKLKYYKPNKTINQQLNTEINQQINKLSKFNSKDYKVIKKETQSLVNEKQNLSKREYLVQLIALRDRLSMD